MADENEVLIVVEVDQSASLADLQQTTESITELENAQEQLNKAVADGKITSDQYKQSRQSLDSQMEVAKTNQKNLTDSLTANNKQLGEGATKSKTLGKEVSSLGKEVGTAKKTTDTFGSALSAQAQGLDQFGIGASGAIDKVKGLTAASLQFLATPIGAIIGIIVAALGTLAAYFKNTGDGADKFAKIMAQLGSVVDVLIDRVSNFGRGLYALLTGDIEAGLFQMNQAFKGVGEEIANDVEVAGKLADTLDELEDAEKDYNVQASKTKNELRLLEIQAKDRTKSETERAAILQKALDIEIKKNKELIDIRSRQLQAAVDEVARRANMQQKENETLQEFADRLVANDKLTDELRDKVRNGIKALNDAEGESLSVQEKIQTKRNELLDKAAEKRKKDAEDWKKTQKKIEEEVAEFYRNMAGNIYQVEVDNNAKRLENVKDLNDKATQAFATTAKSLEVQAQSHQRELTDIQKFGAEARKIISSDEFKQFQGALEGSLDFAKFIYKQVTDDREAEAKKQLDIVTLQMQADSAILTGKYEDDVAALDEKFANSELTEEQYNEKRKLLDTQYKDSKTAIEQQAAYEQDQIKKATFEQNKKIRVADSTIDAIQGSLAAFRSFAPIPFIGVALGTAAALVALKFGMDNVRRIKEQEYVGSGALPPPPQMSSPSSDLGLSASSINAPIDGGLVVDRATEKVNARQTGDTPVIEATVSVVEINDAQEKLAAKVSVAEAR